MFLFLIHAIALLLACRMLSSAWDSLEYDWDERMEELKKAVRFPEKEERKRDRYPKQDGGFVQRED